jgi:hypothetical protein
MVLNFFEWLGQSPLSFFMQQSTYAFAIAEMFHLLSLTILGGAILVINLRLLGMGFRNRTAGQLTQELKVALLTSLGIALTSGTLLLAAEPMKCYDSPAFRAKMLSLLLAILFFFAIQTRILRRDPDNHKPLSRISGAISLILWFTVALSGRAIGLI